MRKVRILARRGRLASCEDRFASSKLSAKSVGICPQGAAKS